MPKKTISRKPLQWVGSFEGFINGISVHDDILTSSQPHTYDLLDFKNRLRTELGKLKDKGIGGVVVNFGYADEYLEGQAGWQRFLTGLKVAVELGMHIWIFDEKGYPSGTADGKVLEGHPELEAIGLKYLSIKKPERSATITIADPRASIRAAYGCYAGGRRKLIAENIGKRFINLPNADFEVIDIYFVAPLFEGTHAACNLSGSRRYINVLDKQAVKRFLQLTYARYFEQIPAELWEHVDAFFNDEISLQSHTVEHYEIKAGRDPVDTTLPLYPSVPWSNDIEAEFLKDHGYALAENLPALFAGFEDNDRRLRHDFWQTVSRLYASAFPKQASSFCAKLNVDFAGHLLGEETLLQQVILHGDMIEVLKAFDRPGVDLLSGRIDLFGNHLLTHKSALSVSFFGTGKGFMSETSDYFERWTGDKSGAPIEEIKCILALQYLLGVRDFCFMFHIPAFSAEEYQDICAFTSRLCELGNEAFYQPECALYYPIEKVWEDFLPSCPSGDVFAAGIFGNTIKQAGPKLQALCRLTTETVKRLFYDNIQYVLCRQHDIRQLAERGINTLVCYGPGSPEPDLNQLCEQAGISLVELSDFEGKNAPKKDIEAGPDVVYATYEGFLFAVNFGDSSSFITARQYTTAVFPLKSNERECINGLVKLPRRSCVFLFEK